MTENKTKQPNNNLYSISEEGQSKTVEEKRIKPSIQPIKSSDSSVNSSVNSQSTNKKK